MKIPQDYLTKWESKDLNSVPCKGLKLNGYESIVWIPESFILATDCPESFYSLEVDADENYQKCVDYERECDKMSEGTVHFDNQLYWKPLR